MQSQNFQQPLACSLLTFQPLLKELVWGGTKLVEKLNKQGDRDKPLGESWELVDLPGNQSLVVDGPFAGTSLETLVSRHGADLMGPVALDNGRFPLLVKYIDAAQTLSVQVHPDEQFAAQLGGRSKNEAWYILDAEPNAVLYLGLKPGTKKSDYEDALAQDRVADLLNAIPARPGLFVHVRPGTLHAIGAGILLAEIQQPSDTTYRVYDWGRMGLDGKPRQLHLQQALLCTNWSAQPIIADDNLDAKNFYGHVQTLTTSAVKSCDGIGPMVIIGLAGQVQINCAAYSQTITRGQVVLVPHCARHATTVVGTSADAQTLSVTFPV